MQRKHTTKILLFFFASLLIGVFSYSETFTAEAATEEIIEARERVGETLKRLDSLDIVGEEEEIIIRKESLAAILSLSRLEIENVTQNLEELEDIHPEVLVLEEHLLQSLKDHLLFVKAREEILPSLDRLETIKTMTDEVVTWRTGYIPDMHGTFDFILTARGNGALRIANARLGKILTYLRENKIAKRERAQIQPLLTEANTHLLEAHESQDEANKILKNRASELLSEAIEEELKVSSEEILVDEAATETPEENLAPAPTIPNLVGQSIEKLKSVYKLFIEIAKVLQ